MHMYQDLHLNSLDYFFLNSLERRESAFALAMNKSREFELIK